MRLAYFLDNEAFRDLADISLRSVRQHMPDVHVVHITNEGFPALVGADTVLRTETPGNFMARWSVLRDQLTGDMLYADADTVFQADVRDVFQRDFQIACPNVHDPHVKFDGGVVFSRSPLFWRELRATPCYTCDRDGRFTVSEIVHTFNAIALDYDPLELPFAYSYVPKGPDDLAEDAKIIHFRGPRKKFMRARYGHR